VSVPEKTYLPQRLREGGKRIGVPKGGVGRTQRNDPRALLLGPNTRLEKTNQKRLLQNDSFYTNGRVVNRKRRGLGEKRTGLSTRPVGIRRRGTF